MAYQEQRCYYCFSPFSRMKNRWVARLDHFVSIHGGGTDDIRNLVYACASCNNAKGASDGESYRARCLRAATPQVRKELQRIHRAVERGKF
jgi:5-methylcytosine-specific restriction endonuclease McrA